MLEYLEPFNCVKTTVILVCKQISSDSFKNKITYRVLNIIAWLELKLAYFEATAQHVNHYARGCLPLLLEAY